MQMALSPLFIPHPSHEISLRRKALAAYRADPHLGGQIPVAVRTAVQVHDAVALPLKGSGVNPLPPRERRAAEYTGELLPVIDSLPVGSYRTRLAAEEITSQQEKKNNKDKTEGYY